MFDSWCLVEDRRYRMIRNTRNTLCIEGLRVDDVNINYIDVDVIGSVISAENGPRAGCDLSVYLTYAHQPTFEEAVGREVIGRRPLPPFAIQPAGALQTRVNAVFFGTVFMYVSVHTGMGEIDMYVRPRYRFLTRVQISRNEVTEFASIGRVSPDDFILPTSLSFAV
ncbi:MAG: hypothetical protein L7H00_04920 [Vulcanisaeta sp.]|nr:hypothetical protein [Vulcanisaeta sp.]